MGSIWQSMQQKGYSRRDFLQFCGVAAAVAGLQKSAVAQVVSAFSGEKRKAAGGLAAFPGVHRMQRVFHPRVASGGRRCSAGRDQPELPGNADGAFGAPGRKKPERHDHE